METSTSSTASRRHSRRVVLVAFLVVAAAVGIVGLVVRAQLDPGDPVAGVTQVAVRDNKLVPTAIEVPAGTTVTWR